MMKILNKRHYIAVSFFALIFIRSAIASSKDIYCISEPFCLTELTDTIHYKNMVKFKATQIYTNDRRIEGEKTSFKNRNKILFIVFSGIFVSTIVVTLLYMSKSELRIKAAKALKIKDMKQQDSRFEQYERSIDSLIEQLEHLSSDYALLIKQVEEPSMGLLRKIAHTVSLGKDVINQDLCDILRIYNAIPANTGKTILIEEIRAVNLEETKLSSKDISSIIKERVNDYTALFKSIKDILALKHKYVTLMEANKEDIGTLLNSYKEVHDKLIVLSDNFKHLVDAEKNMPDILKNICSTIEADIMNADIIYLDLNNEEIPKKEIKVGLSKKSKPLEEHFRDMQIISEKINNSMIKCKNAIERISTMSSKVFNTIKNLKQMLKCDS